MLSTLLPLLVQFQRGSLEAVIKEATNEMEKDYAIAMVKGEFKHVCAVVNEMEKMTKTKQSWFTWTGCGGRADILGGDIPLCQKILTTVKNVTSSLSL